VSVFSKEAQYRMPFVRQTAGNQVTATTFPWEVFL